MAASGWRAGGVMLQHMPCGWFALMTSEEATGRRRFALIAADLAGWGWEVRTGTGRIFCSIPWISLSLVGPSIEPTQLLLRLFHEEQPRVYDTQPVTFGCTCSGQTACAKACRFIRPKISGI